MASTAETKVETKEIQKVPENATNENSDDVLVSEEKPESPEASDTCSQKDKKKKRPISTVLHGSLKRHTPKFFTPKRQSESTVSLNENIRKSATDMWNEVKGVFRRMSVKKENKQDPPNQNGSVASSDEKKEGVGEENDMTCSKVVTNTEKSDTDKEAESKEVVVLETGSTIEIIEDEDTKNSQELSDNNEKEVMNGHADDVVAKT